MQEDDEDNKSVASISFNADGMPSREELLKLMGYQGISVALCDAESDGEYKCILNRIGMFNQG